MKRFLQDLLRPPVFENDERKTRSVAFFHTVLLVIIVSAIAIDLISPGFHVRRTMIFMGLVVMAVGSLILLKRKHVTSAGATAMVGAWLVFSYASLTGGGVYAPAFNGFLLIILLSGLVFGKKGILWSALLVLITISVIIILQLTDSLPGTQVIHSPLYVWIVNFFYLIIGSILLAVALGRMEDSFSRLQVEFAHRLKTQDALISSEAKFASVVQNSADIISLHDEEFRFTYCSSAVTRILGFTPEELIGKFPMEVCHPDDLLLVKRGLQTLARGRKKGVPVPFRLCRKDGTWIPVESVGINLLDNELVRGYVITTRDVSEQHRTLSALHTSESRFRSLVEETPDSIVLINEDGVIVDMNKSSEILSGQPINNWIGQKIWDYVYAVMPPLKRKSETLDRLKETYTRGLATGVSELFDKTFEVTIHHPDGNIRYLEQRIFPISVEHGRIVGALSHDITKRKLAEQAMLESEGRLRTISEATFEGIGFSDQGIILDANDQLVEMLGYTREELLGRQVMDLVADEDRERVMAIVLRGDPGPYEHRVKQKNGTLIDVEVRARHFNYQGKQIRISAIRDITERKRTDTERARLQEQLQQAQKMETIGRMAGGIAHDFNNLLAPILGYSEVLLMDLSPNDPRSKRVKTIKEAAEKSAHLIRQLLTMSRKQVIDATTLNLNTVLSDLERILYRTIREDVKIHYTLAQNLKSIKADPSKMEQVIVNLMVNAQDAMPNGGNIFVETSNSIVDERTAHFSAGLQSGQYVMLTITDNGAGIDQETLKHIFEPFFTTKEKEKGTGLGLATVYGIVQQHGGTITVYSEPQRGASFRIYLPAIEGIPEVTHTGSHPSERQVGHETIILAEDSELVRHMACQMLTESGYTVIETTDSQDCIRVFQEQKEKIDLLLTDVVMPDMNGKELYDTLAAEKPTLRVAFMSGYPEDVIANRGVLNEGITFIQKPFTIETLGRKIREALDKK